MKTRKYDITIPLGGDIPAHNRNAAKITGGLRGWQFQADVFSMMMNHKQSKM
jgi:hypothetical protein